MKSNKGKPFIITTIIGLGIAAIFFGASTQFILSEWNIEYYGYLADALFIPGYLMVLFGLLIVIDNNSGFDFIRFGLRRFWQVLKRQKEYEGPKTFFEYRLMESEKESSRLYIPILVVGGCMVILASIALLLYYQL
jgi:hypothetical protein